MACAMERTLLEKASGAVALVILFEYAVFQFPDEAIYASATAVPFQVPETTVPSHDFPETVSAVVEAFALNCCRAVQVFA